MLSINLSNNEYIIEFLNNYEHKIDFYYLVSNKNAIDLIEKNLDEIISDKYDQYQIWEYLCKNYNAIIDALEKEKSNNTLKGDLIKGVFATSTMGVSYKVKLGKSI